MRETNDNKRRGLANDPTFTFLSLSDHSPEQAAAVIAEGGAHVVVHLEAVRHVDLEALLLELHTHRATVIAHRPNGLWPQQGRLVPAHPTPKSPHLGQTRLGAWAVVGSSWRTKRDRVSRIPPLLNLSLSSLSLCPADPHWSLNQ